MFQSIKYLQYLGYNEKLKDHVYEYELIDSEFGTITGSGGSAGAGSCAVAYARVGAGEFIIRTYEEKGRNVPENFARYIRYVEKQHGKYGYTSQWMLDWHTRYNKRFPPYKNDILKELDRLKSEEQANTRKLKDVPIGTEVSLNGYSENATIIGRYNNGSTILAWKNNPKKNFHWEIAGSSVMALEYKGRLHNPKSLEDVSQFKYAFVARGDRDCQVVAEPKTQATETKTKEIDPQDLEFDTYLKDLPLGSEVRLYCNGKVRKAKMIGSNNLNESILLGFDEPVFMSTLTWPKDKDYITVQANKFLDEDLSVYKDCCMSSNVAKALVIKRGEGKTVPKPSEYLPLKDVPIGSEIEVDGIIATVVGRNLGYGNTLIGTKTKTEDCCLPLSSISTIPSNTYSFLEGPSYYLEHQAYKWVDENLAKQKVKVLSKPTTPPKTVSKFPHVSKQMKPTFKRIEYLGYKGYNETTKLHEYNYKIVDEGFEWSGAGVGAGGFADVNTGASAGAGAALIACYEEKGLPVPENYAAYIQFITANHSKFGYTTDWMIQHHSTWNPKFAKYKDEVLKILGKVDTGLKDGDIITANTVKQSQDKFANLLKDTMNEEIKAQTQSVKEASETIRTATRSIEEIAKTLREEKKLETTFAEANDLVSKVIGTDDVVNLPGFTRSQSKVGSIGEEVLKAIENKQAAASLKAQVEKAMKSVEELEVQMKERERTLTKRTISATKLAMQMQKNGLIHDWEFDRQVENILGWNEHAYQMMKKTVDKLAANSAKDTQITIIDGKHVAELKPDGSVVVASKTEETAKPTFTDTLKSEVKDAGYRVAATKLTSVVKNGILALLKSKGLDGGKIQTFSELLDTEIGGVFIAELLGHGLPYIPHVKNDPRIQRLATEFRIGGYHALGNEVIGGLLEHILPAITNVMKELPSDKEEVVRVSERVVEETKTIEQPKEPVKTVEPLSIDLTSSELEEAIRLEDEEAIAEEQSMSG